MKAFQTYDLAGTTLANRIVMAPMTRSRAQAPEMVPTALTAEYYAQRATAGLIVTEGIQPSAQGQGYTNTPGLHSHLQVEAWKPVTAGVHAAGGAIFAQLMHAGRIGHPSVSGLTPVGPSPIAANGKVFTDDGMKDFAVPRELTDAEIRITIDDYVTAARNAIAAGFDGVEIHGANGYLIHQFLSVNANRRTDDWGGTPENRMRLALEVARAVSAAIGAHRTGMRLSPGGAFNDIVEDADLDAVYLPLVQALGTLDLAYVHLAEQTDRALSLRLRAAFPNTFILNPKTGTPTGPEALALIDDGTTDLVSFGALFIANPDLVSRLAAGGPFNTPDNKTFYGGGAQGYTDYPTLR
ncbi:MAG: alkene reductase [Actinomycetia bacterium]|nr:alkene reductase [Actinomycetes bacterium]